MIKCKIKLRREREFHRIFRGKEMKEKTWDGSKTLKKKKKVYLYAQFFLKNPNYPSNHSKVLKNIYINNFKKMKRLFCSCGMVALRGARRAPTWAFRPCGRSIETPQNGRHNYPRITSMKWLEVIKNHILYSKVQLSCNFSPRNRLSTAPRLLKLIKAWIKVRTHKLWKVSTFQKNTYIGVCTSIKVVK